ncbi:MAG: C-type lectin domain-containing protein [Polyangiaceae bacterium]
MSYLGSPYLICTPGHINKNAEYACSQFTMHLPKLVSPYEAAWLSTVMFMKDASRFWVGAKFDPSQTPPSWAWDVDSSTLVPPATADDDYNLWKSEESADPSGGKACLVLDGGNYVSANCDEVHPFACQFAQ